MPSSHLPAIYWFTSALSYNLSLANFRPNFVIVWYKSWCNHQALLAKNLINFSSDLTKPREFMKVSSNAPISGNAETGSACSLCSVRQRALALLRECHAKWNLSQLQVLIAKLQNSIFRRKIVHLNSKCHNSQIQFWRILHLIAGYQFSAN
jgi:hypothetical protein